MSFEGQERRKFPRALFPCKIILGSPVRLITSHTENIGEGGFRVLLEEKLSVFTNVGVEIFLEKDKPIKCKGRIVWVVEKVNPLAGESLMFDTGVEFTDMGDHDKSYVVNLVDTLLIEKKELER